MDDQNLLQAFVAHHSETAFAEMVRRHLPLVYGTARRLLEGSGAAEDVAQQVFLQLARKAWRVRAGALPGWLYRATRGAALNHRRGEQRRRQREIAAMNLIEQNTDSTTAWAHLAPLLDEAMSGLNQVEQDALVMRYFQGQSLNETGRRLSLSEAAAQKRVGRALEKLRTRFARMGVTTSAALLSSTLGSHAAAPPPPALAAKISGQSLARGAGATGWLYLMLRIFLMNTKTQAMLAALVAVAILAAIWLKLTFATTASNSIAVMPPAHAARAATTAPASPPVTIATAVDSRTASTATVPAASTALDANPQADLHEVIADVLRLLNTSDYEDIFRKYMPPAAVAEIKSKLLSLNLPPERLAKIMNAEGQFSNEFYNGITQDFGQDATIKDAREDAVYILNAIKDTTPVITNNRAVFKNTPRPGRNPADVVFVKENGLWYLEVTVSLDFDNHCLSLAFMPTSLSTAPRKWQPPAQAPPAQAP